MERRSGEQRLKIDERHGRTAHIYGHSLPSRLHRSSDHLYHPLLRHDQRAARRQVHALHQHHRQARERLRQQVPRVHKSGERHPFFSHDQNDPTHAILLISSVDKVSDSADKGRQQA